MNRLVYSPKVYAFVRTTDTAKAKTPYFDITNYIVRGNVTRVVGAASTATLTLRNPRKMFTGGDGHGPKFHPMDPITIWMSRYEDYPLQVFTGFLDKTPYLQLFPGTCTLQASCTLKRLLNTYWDPALPFTKEFMASYGWFQDQTTGQMQNVASQTATVGDKGLLSDGSIAQVLYGVLTEPRLGNWKKNEVFIEQLPADLMDRIKDIYLDLATDQQILQEQLTTLFTTVVGSGSHGSGGGNPNGGSTSGSPALGGSVAGEENIIKTMITIAHDKGVPPEMVIATAFVENDPPGPYHTNGSKYYGWFQIDLNGSRYSPPCTEAEANDLQWSCTAFCNGAINTVPKSVDHSYPYLNWAMYTQGVNAGNNPRYPATWDRYIAKAKQLIAKYGSSLPYAPGTLDTSSASSSSTQSGGVKKQGTGTYGAYSAPFPSGTHYVPGRIDQGYDIEEMPVGTDVLSMTNGVVTAVNSNEVGGDPHNGGGFGPNYPIIKVSDGPLKGRLIYYGHVNPCLVKAGDTVSAGQPIAKIQAIDGVGNGGGHIEIGFFDPIGTVSPPSGGPMRDIIDTLFNDGTDFGTVSAAIGNDSGGTTLDNSTATAFANQVSWPSVEEGSEAILLQGQKSLMNDKQIMPFIQELTSAALRQFQSLPNGDFFAFFPDYFGDFGHRKAYWKIHDIEILDGKIELTDDFLATHVYIVGDTGVPFDGVNFVDKILSGGVISVFNAFKSKFVLGVDEGAKAGQTSFRGRQTEGQVLLAEQKDAVAFLKRYGARPYYEEVPAIRSPYYEAFYAFQTFQLLWSRTFLTEFSFTFMPELYPGGIVAFDDHGLQCYVDSVSHDFDYEAGFTTTAQLSAPAHYGPGRDDLGLSQGLVRGSAK